MNTLRYTNRINLMITSWANNIRNLTWSIDDACYELVANNSETIADRAIGWIDKTVEKAYSVYTRLNPRRE